MASAVSAPVTLSEDLLVVKQKILETIRRRENPHAKSMNLVLTLPQFVPYTLDQRKRTQVIHDVKAAIEQDGIYALKYKAGKTSEPDGYTIFRKSPLPSPKMRELEYSR